MRITKIQADMLKTEVKLVRPEAKIYLLGNENESEDSASNTIELVTLTNERLSTEERSRLKYVLRKSAPGKHLEVMTFTFNEHSPVKDLLIAEGTEI